MQQNKNLYNQNKHKLTSIYTFELLSDNLIIGSFLRKSHTTV